MDRHAESRRIARELVDELGSPLNFVLQLFLNQQKDIVISDHVFIVHGKIKGLLRHAASTGGLTFDPHWPSIDISQTAESLFSQKAVDIDMHINQTVARHFASSRWDPAVIFLPRQNVPSFPSSPSSSSGGGGSNDNHQSGSTNNSPSSHHSSNSNEHNITAKYFSKEGLFDVVSDLRSTKATGIFIEYRAPIDGYHNLLRATFTPFLLLMEMRRCGVALKDGRTPLKYRVSTSAQNAVGSGGGTSSASNSMASSMNSSSPYRNQSSSSHHHHRHNSAKEITVPQSASTLVVDMLNALINKRQEHGEFVERCVAYFSVISPKQVLLLWCTQINVMPLEHAVQLSEEVTSLKTQQSEQDQQNQQKQQQDQQTEAASTKKSAAGKTQQQQQQNTSATTTGSPTSTSAVNTSTSTTATSHHTPKKLHHHPGTANQNATFSSLNITEISKIGASGLTPALLHDMTISPHENEYSCHGEKVKQESYILQCLPESMTAMRETDYAASSLRRVRESYHSKLIEDEKREKEKQQQRKSQQQQRHKKEEEVKEQKQDDESSTAVVIVENKKESDDSQITPKKEQQEKEENESDKENNNDQNFSPSFVNENENENEISPSNNSSTGSSNNSPSVAGSIRSLATAAAARKIARLFGVNKSELPPPPKGLDKYKQAARDQNDYDASRMSSVRKKANAKRLKVDKEKVNLALEKAKLRREAKEKQRQELTAAAATTTTTNEDEQSEQIEISQIDSNNNGNNSNQDDENDKNNEDENENENNNENDPESSAFTLMPQLPSAAQRVHLMKDRDFDETLLEMQQPTWERFDTGLSGYVLDMPANYIFNQHYNNNGKKQGGEEGGGLLDTLLDPIAIREQKRKERIARTQPALEVTQDTGASFLEQTVSSKLGTELLSSRLLKIRPRGARKPGMSVSDMMFNHIQETWNVEGEEQEQAQQQQQEDYYNAEHQRQQSHMMMNQSTTSSAAISGRHPHQHQPINIITTEISTGRKRSISPIRLKRSSSSTSPRSRKGSFGGDHHHHLHRTGSPIFDRKSSSGNQNISTSTTGGDDENESNVLDVQSYFQNFPTPKRTKKQEKRRKEKQQQQQQQQHKTTGIYQEEGYSSERGDYEEEYYDEDEEYEFTSDSELEEEEEELELQRQRKQAESLLTESFKKQQEKNIAAGKIPSIVMSPEEKKRQDEKKYSYTVQRIRALGQMIFQTAADLLYRSVSHQSSRRGLVEIVIPFGFRHIDQELRSVFMTLGLEERALDAMGRIAEFREQHENDGTSYGELALNTPIGDGGASMFEDENFVRQSNGTVASVRDEWYSLEGGGSVVFVLRDALIAVPRAEKLLLTLEQELNPLNRFDTPLCSVKDAESCKRLCELVAERGFTICDACHVLATERNEISVK